MLQIPLGKLNPTQKQKQANSPTSLFWSIPPADEETRNVRTKQNIRCEVSSTQFSSIEHDKNIAYRHPRSIFSLLSFSQSLSFPLVLSLSPSFSVALYADQSLHRLYTKSKMI